MLGEYVENRILGMDKGGGGYHFFENPIFKIQFDIS